MSERVREREGVSARTRASDMGRRAAGRVLGLAGGLVRCCSCMGTLGSVCVRPGPSSAEAGTGVLHERKSPQGLGVARCEKLGGDGCGKVVRGGCVAQCEEGRRVWEAPAHVSWLFLRLIVS